MAKGFNPLMAFGSGVMTGIANTEAEKRAQQEKIDDEYRQMAMKIDYEREVTGIRKQYDDEQSQTQYNKFNQIAGLSKQNTTNQATYDSLKSSQNNPDIAQNNDITGQSSPPPTNTPQTNITNPPPAQVQPTAQVPQAAPVQNQSPQGTPSTPSQGGLNSPQGGEVPIQVPQQTPQQGDATNPLSPPNKQQDAVDLSGGTPTIPTGEDEIIDSFGNKLTRSQASRAVAYGMEETSKTKGAMTPEAGYWIGVGKVLKEDGELGSKIHATGLNEFGFNIGTVPDGFTVPALPETFDMTKRMNSAKASQKLLNDEKGLSADRDAGIQANKAATEFSLYLAGNDAGDSGGLNKIGFIRDFTGAMSTTDATLDSVNKSLTFNIVGFERTPGMRLTQAEFFIAREAMPGRGNTAEANKNIAQFWQAKLQLPQEWAQFKQDYMAVNGSWNEAIGERMFQQYQKDNPIFDPAILANPEKAKLSDFALNPNRQSLEKYAQSGGWNKLKFLGMKDIVNTSQSPMQPSTQEGQSAPKGGVISYQEYFK